MMRKPKAEQVNVLGDRFMPVAIPGLVAAYRIVPGLSPAALEPAEVAPALAASEGWVWLHFALTDTLARAYIAKLEALPPEAREALLAAEDQLTIGRGDAVIFGNVADFERDLDADREEVGRLRFALTERLAVTGRRHPLRSLDELRQALHEGAGPATPGALIETVIDRFCDAVARTASRMSNELDRIEDHVVSDLVERERSRLMPVRRTAVRMHRQLASLAAILREHGEDEPEAEEGSPLRIDADRLASRLAALDQDVLSLQDRARLLQDEVAARLAEETNASLKALSRMTALLLPGSLIAGIWGMNVHGLPFLEADHGFSTVMIMGLVATAIFYWLLRRSGA